MKWKSPERLGVKEHDVKGLSFMDEVKISRETVKNVKGFSFMDEVQI